MLKLLKDHNRLNETFFLGTLTLISFSLSIIRLMFSGTFGFLFLNWNLFLAFIPWLFTSAAILIPRIQKSKLTISIMLLSWLLFFPNAPYILTDLYHLRFTSAVPIWFDLILILSFAWTGLLFGFLSLLDLEKLLFKNSKLSCILSVVFIFIASFGIYLGRYLRWNSWDIISEPLHLLFDIGDRIINPFAHPRTWGVTLFMGLFLNIIYWSFKFISKRKL
jgi:uncharacterized membrane protein